MCSTSRAPVIDQTQVCANCIYPNMERTFHYYVKLRFNEMIYYWLQPEMQWRCWLLNYLAVGLPAGVVIITRARSMNSLFIVHKDYSWRDVTGRVVNGFSHQEGLVTARHFAVMLLISQTWSTLLCEITWLFWISFALRYCSHMSLVVLSLLCSKLRVTKQFMFLAHVLLLLSQKQNMRRIKQWVKTSWSYLPVMKQVLLVVSVTEPLTSWKLNRQNDAQKMFPRN